MFRRYGYRYAKAGLLTLAMIVALPFVLSAASVARMEAGAARIDWIPQSDYELLVLTVAGPSGLDIRREFGPGELPSLGLEGENGSLPDGSYMYELRMISRKSPKAPSRAAQQSGTFLVRDGSFVAPPFSPPAPLRPAIDKQTIPEDLLVQGDLVVDGNSCLGDACTTTDTDFPIVKLKSALPILQFEDTDSIDWMIEINPVSIASNRFYVRDLSADTIPFALSGSAPDYSIFVRDNGNVGFGTALPSLRLDARASTTGTAVGKLQNSNPAGYSGLEYANSLGTTVLYFGTDNASANTRLNSVNNYPISILTNSTERMRITSGGSVGIGTSAPSSKFHVNGGDIRVSGGAFIDDGVTLNTPDYVFEPGYELMPLDDLKEFVARERHLPNVPSAREVKEQGLNLSQFQMRLLEKVEELTLYTLKQQEELRRLQEENRLFQARLAALEKSEENRSLDENVEAEQTPSLHGF